MSLKFGVLWRASGGVGLRGEGGPAAHLDEAAVGGRVVGRAPSVRDRLERVGGHQVRARAWTRLHHRRRRGGSGAEDCGRERYLAPVLERSHIVTRRDEAVPRRRHLKGTENARRQASRPREATERDSGQGPMKVESDHPRVDRPGPPPPSTASWGYSRSLRSLDRLCKVDFSLSVKSVRI